MFCPDNLTYGGKVQKESEHKKHKLSINTHVHCLGKVWSSQNFRNISENL